MIKIKNLHANVEGNEILKGLDLSVNAGEIHAIMGPNGSGKSTLANVLAGSEAYEVTEGEIIFNNHDIIEMEPDERAREGLFLAFQYPIEIPGVSNSVFLKTALNEIRKHRGEEEISAKDFLALIKEKTEILNMDNSLIGRSVNQGFSGGEKKRNEILQLLTLNPKLAVLDETDSGLDIDALKVVARGVNKFKNENNAVILVTHYQRLLDYIVPDFVHVLYKGKIVKSGDKTLALELEKHGYDWLIKEQSAEV
ncbi:MAG: Fe-S cluster assembly ATPase SufC [Ignavibacteriae bacterium]|nr:MAG: Fe-S cluster assembly ATPase SufC [Ignavibacteriota bacterium]